MKRNNAEAEEISIKAVSLIAIEESKNATPKLDITKILSMGSRRNRDSAWMPSMIIAKKSMTAEEKTRMDEATLRICKKRLPPLRNKLPTTTDRQIDL